MAQLQSLSRGRWSRIRDNHSRHAQFLCNLQGTATTSDCDRYQGYWKRIGLTQQTYSGIMFP